MSTNKNAIIRFQALDKCFRNPSRKYFINDLVYICNESLTDIDNSTSGIKKRQVYDDIKFMKDSKGYDAPIESFKDGRKAYYRYTDTSFSINNQPLNEHEAQQLKESLLTITRFKGLPQFDWVEEIKIRLEQSFKLKTNETILSFDENIFLKGRNHIGYLYNAIINNRCLTIEYKPFQYKNNIINFQIHPYHLKQYNNRWFLFGLDDVNTDIINLALDRIIFMKENNILFVENNDIDFNEYFEDVIGVSVPYDSKPEKIVLKINSALWPYIKTKPLHGSQKKIKESDSFHYIEIEVIPNYELQSLIMSFGNNVEVISPYKFRMRIKENHKTSLSLYE